jgi:hypothetical protein
MIATANQLRWGIVSSKSLLRFNHKTRTGGIVGIAAVSERPTRVARVVSTFCGNFPCRIEK